MKLHENLNFFFLKHKILLSKIKDNVRTFKKKNFVYYYTIHPSNYRGLNILHS